MIESGRTASPLGLCDLVRKEKEGREFLVESLIWVKGFGEKWREKYEIRVFFFFALDPSAFIFEIW